MEPEKNSAYSVEQLVAIGDHIHNCHSSFIISTKLEPDDVKNVLTSMTGSFENQVCMLYETMKTHPEIANVVETACKAYKMYVEKSSQSN